MTKITVKQVSTTVSELIKKLQEYEKDPNGNDNYCYAYEGESCSVVVVDKNFKKEDSFDCYFDIDCS